MHLNNKKLALVVLIALIGMKSAVAAEEVQLDAPRPLIEDNSVRSQSTTLAYAQVGYKFNSKTKLTLDVFNLFNRVLLE